MKRRTKNSARWNFWIDRGGTFTDVIGRAPSGRLHVEKLLSDNPRAYDDPALAGIRRILGLPARAPLPDRLVGSVRFGATVGAQALLDRTGARVLLVTTRGFRDALEIGDQARSDLFALQGAKPDQLYAGVLEVDERVRADGTIETALDPDRLRKDLLDAHAQGYRAAAVVFMHGWRHSAHEKLAARVLADCGFTQISISHVVAPQAPFIGRSAVTVADACLSPPLARAVERIASGIGASTRLLCLHSAGGLALAEAFTGKDAMLSAPAGGVIAMAETARAAGFTHVIGFDMGAGSTRLSHFAGEIERAPDSVIAGVSAPAPALQIDMVALGGGSVLALDGGQMRVGPGVTDPVCHRRGGLLALTDANVMTGKLLPDLFPALFGPSQNDMLDAALVRDRFTALAKAAGPTRSPESIADECIAVAVTQMAEAVRRMAAARGCDLTSYVLNAFGGAGGQHACLVADALGMTRVLAHPLASVLSAYGIGMAEPLATHREYVYLRLDARSVKRMRALARRLKARGDADLRRLGVEKKAMGVRVSVRLKAANADLGVDAPVKLEGSERLVIARLKTAFHKLHAARFGFVDRAAAVVVDAVSVEVFSRAARPHEAVARRKPGPPAKPLRKTRFFSQGAWREARVYARESLTPGARVKAPALIVAPHQTIVVEEGWRAEVTPRNHVVLTRVKPPGRKPATGAKIVAARLEAFRIVAEQMGDRLREATSSVNLGERRDFSCAILDAKGRLVSHGRHMPLQIGAMDRALGYIIRANKGKIRPGDVFASNAPSSGGVDLSDILVCTPLFERGGAKKILLWVATCARHADVGGLAPGSMSPLARRSDEEGALIDNLRLVAGGRFQERAVLEALMTARYPARNPVRNLADLKAQVAANAHGVDALRRLIALETWPVVNARMGQVEKRAAARVTSFIGTLQNAQASVELDDGSAIRVAIVVDAKARRVRVDFSGTSPQRGDSRNASEAVTHAAVLYAFRVLAGGEMPMNAGLLRPVEIIIPKGSMLSPLPPAAVAGGVEIGAAVVDALFAALGQVGSSQGTMNSLTFGNIHYQHLETLASGAPATEGFDGAASMQAHLTNARLTDPEALEMRFPVVLQDAHIMRGSGGAGKWRAGDGVSRTVRFLDDMHMSIVSDHRVIPPAGTQGGAPGRLGRNLVRRADGHIETLNGCVQMQVHPGDSLTIETPTGGGFGPRD